MNLRPGRGSAGSLVAVVLAVGVFAQDRSPVAIRTVPIAEGVYILTGNGGHTLVLAGDEGTLLVDAGYKQNAGELIAAVKKVRDAPILYLVNTHWHFDHVGGNAALQKAGATIVAQENVRKCMSAARYIAHYDHTEPAAPAAALPTITFDHSLTLHFNGESVQIVHVDPGHTGGDSFVYLREANVLLLGDTCFKRAYPFIDVEANGTVDGLIGAADRALALADDQTQIVPGHGPLVSLADIRAFREMVTTTRDRVRALTQEGKSCAEAVAAKPTKDLDGRWGQDFFGPDIWVEMVYDSLKRSQGNAGE